MRAVGVIQAHSANQIRILAFNALDRGENHTRIAEVDAAVVIEIVHTSITVAVDDYVGGISELVAAVARATTLVAEPEVVFRRPET